MDLIYSIDELILKWVTKIAHKIQDLTGRNNFFLAKIMLWGVIINCLVICFNYYFKVLVMDTDIISMILNIIITLIYSSFINRCTQAERASMESETPTMYFANGIMQKLTRFIITVYTVGMLPINVYEIIKGNFIFFEILHTSGYICLVLFTYLCVVTPKPPSKSKIKQWIEKMFKARFLPANG